MKTVIYNGIKHNVFKIKTEFGNIDIILCKKQYRNPETLAVAAMEVENGEVNEEYDFAVLTVNLDGYTGLGQQSDTRAYVDCNNCGWARSFLEGNAIAKPTGIFTLSGFCTYPLYEWDTTKFYAE